MLSIEVAASRRLRFDDGSPVRAASAVAPLGAGWLVAQDDAAHAAWVRGGSIRRLRIVPSVHGHDVFSSAAGTKHLKPDLEAACPVQDRDGGPAVLLLGSGSTPQRMRGALVSADGRVRLADLATLYARVAQVLSISPDQLNLEGACLTGDVVRWFARGNLRAGVPSASVDLPVAQLVAAFSGSAVDDVGALRRYDVGEVDGVGLTVTDAVALPDGRVVISAAAEDTPNAVEDGPVVAAALAVLDGQQVTHVTPLPTVQGEVAKVEGLALVEIASGRVRLLAVVDDDDAEAASTELLLDVRLP